MTSEIGTTACSKIGFTTFSPSTADSTEIAGVITPSPKNSAAPAMPITTTTQRPRVVTLVRSANAISARMPPSPRLSARMMTMTYLTVTVSISAQNTRLSTPRISHRSIPPSWKWSKEARSA